MVVFPTCRGPATRIAPNILESVFTVASACRLIYSIKPLLSTDLISDIIIAGFLEKINRIHEFFQIHCGTRLKSGKLLEIPLVFCYNFIISFIDCIFAVIVFRLHSVWENIFQALFLCFLTGSTEPGGHIGASLCVYNFILAVWQQSTQRMCKFILWVLFLYRSEP